MLRHASSQLTSKVNGILVTRALLGHGDVVEFDPQSRWCVEMPVPATAGAVHVHEADACQDERAGQPAGRRSWKHWSWLLASALLLSALLSALLLFGPS